jgi:hypothetical protein
LRLARKGDGARQKGAALRKKSDAENESTKGKIQNESTKGDRVLIANMEQPVRRYGHVMD